jgi:hypothetical protein
MVIFVILIFKVENLWTLPCVTRDAGIFECITKFNTQICFAVRLAGLAHVDSTVSLKDFGIQNHVAIWAYASSKSNSGLLA